MRAPRWQVRHCQSGRPLAPLAPVGGSARCCAGRRRWSRGRSGTRGVSAFAAMGGCGAGGGAAAGWMGVAGTGVATTAAGGAGAFGGSGGGVSVFAAMGGCGAGGGTTAAWMGAAGTGVALSAAGVAGAFGRLGQRRFDLRCNGRLRHWRRRNRGGLFHQRGVLRRNFHRRRATILCGCGHARLNCEVFALQRGGFGVLGRGRRARRRRYGVCWLFGRAFIVRFAHRTTPIKRRRSHADYRRGLTLCLIVANSGMRRFASQAPAHRAIDVRMRRLSAPAQEARRNSSEAFVPPKPKEFDKAILISFSRALCGTRSIVVATEGLSRLRVGGATFACIARIE